ncbi:MAG: zinc ribbon domain-containing protein [Candidatus Aenigmatarchaeota archaeon]
MDCQRCKGEMKDGWLFCPACGARKGADPDEVMGRDFFSKLLSGFKENMGKDDGAFPGMPGGVKGPVFSGPVKIKISATNAGRPGPVGIRIMDGEGRPAGGSSHESPGEGQESLAAAEPQVRTTMEQGRMLAELSVPGVKSARDVSIKELPSSVEVRASSEDKLYFRILKKPVAARVSAVSLDGGVLRIKF